MYFDLRDGTGLRSAVHWAFGSAMDEFIAGKASARGEARRLARVVSLPDLDAAQKSFAAFLDALHAAGLALRPL